MTPRKLEIGDVVQLNPDHENFPGAIVVVTEPKEFGCQGYLMSEYNFQAATFRGIAYLRPKWEEMEYVGKIVWLNERKCEKVE